jgi:photosystem II stability/assembly factor-like uncharacterized protein
MNSHIQAISRYPLWGLLLISFLLYAAPAQGQWQRVALPPWLTSASPTIFGTHFLDYVGHPEIGFTYGSGLYRTTDGGTTWKKIDDRLYLESDMTFKDKLTGWVTYLAQPPTGYSGVAKTTDGGESWILLPLTGSGPPSKPIGLFYSHSSKLLLSGGAWNKGWIYRSSDEGATWEQMTPEGRIHIKFAFASPDTGILSAGWGVGTRPNQTTPWKVTTDGGRSWRDLAIDSSSWQPLAVAHTQTYFALTPHGNFLRTDDNWNSWRLVCTFPAHDFGIIGEFWQNTSTVRGNLDSLFVQTTNGIQLSTDEGITWRSLCGPRIDDPKFTSHYVVGRTVFCSNAWTPWSSHGYFWRLNLDSLNIPTDISCRFINDKKTIALDDSREVRVLCKIIDRTPDSARVRIRYDLDAFKYSHAELPNGWTARESSESGAVDLTVVKGPTALKSDSLFTLVFSTIVSKKRAELIVEAQKVFSYEFDAECVASRYQRPDTLTVLFADCESSLLLDHMGQSHSEKAIEIKSINPNPTQGSITIDYESKLKGAVTLTVYSVDGVRVHEQVIASDPQKPLQLETSGWSSGAYTIVLKCGESEARGGVVKN